MKQKKHALRLHLVYKIKITCRCDSDVLMNHLQLSIEEIVSQFPDYLKGLAAKNEVVEVHLDKQKSKEIQ